jgi:hypothetical protein
MSALLKVIWSMAESLLQGLSSLAGGLCYHKALKKCQPNPRVVYLKQLVDGKRVTVEIYGVDRYKRLLSTIFIDGKDINLAMIEVGLAEVYRGPESGNPYKVQYQVAEEVARSARKGMWVLGETYESPRAYRKRVGIS